MLHDHDLLRQSVVEVINQGTFEALTGTPVEDGVMDPKLGALSKNKVCTTCGFSFRDCMGHFGHIELAVPVFHVGYFKHMMQVLNQICKTCSRVLVSEDFAKTMRDRIARVGDDDLRRRVITRAVLEECKRLRNKVCPHCKSVNGVVKKGPNHALSIIHETSAPLVSPDDDVVASPTHVGGKKKSKFGETLTPLHVLSLLRNLNYEDCALLDVDSRVVSSAWVVKRVPVPPLSVRPSVMMEGQGGSHEDDLTIQLIQMVKVNQLMMDGLARGESIVKLASEWDALQSLHTAFVNSEFPGIETKAKRGFVQRLKGKHGRFRQNLSGKRVNFSSRSTISPDPNLMIDEVGIPEEVAKTLTYTEIVTPMNMERLRKAIINGPHIHPGAVQISSKVTDDVFVHKSTLFGNNVDKANSLAVGDLVERHLRDGDFVLFNRQPSLHRLSIMCHKARVMKYKTFRLNEAVCTPYGADFDGDEMNVHVPQTEEARVEAALLMGVRYNMVTPKTGEPIVAAIQDFITASYLLTQKDRFFDKSQFCQIVTCISDAKVAMDLPSPVILKPVRLWTGKQVFSVLLQTGFTCRSGITFEARNRTFSLTDETSKFPFMDPRDSYVVFRRSELVCGMIDKKIIGTGSKQNLLHYILHELGPAAATEKLSNLAKICARFLGDLGFSIGLDDVSPSEKLISRKKTLIESGFAKCDQMIAQHRDMVLSSASLEQQVQQELSALREKAGKACTEELKPYNSALIMTNCGSKGSALNISQMVALAGQQILMGQRVPDGFTGRSLPHFEKESKDPAARGFVQGSFFSGLSPPEFFFHTMAGREGIVDTAVKTAETGYIQRRLVKSLEDISAQYDGTARTSAGHVIQFVYGDDGLDPSKMAAEEDQPIQLEAVLVQCMAECDKVHDACMTLEDLANVVLHLQAVARSCHWSKRFLQKCQDFISNLSDKKSVAARLVQAEKCSNGDVDVQRKLFPISKRVMTSFIEKLKSKYARALVEPGTAVGALCAQSIGEPATQMTLKTFHSAGIGSNITMGVPRLSELINGSKSIATPLITAVLDSNVSQEQAKGICNMMHGFRLRDVAENMSVFSMGSGTIRIALKQSFAWITAKAVAARLVGTRELRLKSSDVVVKEGERVIDVEVKGATLFERVSQLLLLLPEVLVTGLPTVSGVAFQAQSHRLLVEGTGLASVMTSPGIDTTKTISNSVLEVKAVLGIEAARSCFAQELRYVMEQHSIDLSKRHVDLIADYMTWTGEVLGINRFGMGHIKRSPMMMASFEQTAENLYDAALHGRFDPVSGVSESIIMGQAIPVGTGSITLRQQKQQRVHDDQQPPPPLLLYKTEFNQ